MAFDYELEELEETVDQLSEYYSQVTGRDIGMGVDEDLDIWINSSRTNGREYVADIEELERRIKLLYQDLIEDDDYPVDEF